MGSSKLATLFQALLVLIEITGFLGIHRGVPVQHYPFFVTVETDKFICGGTIIATDTVLTAARCLYNPQASSTELHFIIKSIHQNCVF